MKNIKELAVFISQLQTPNEVEQLLNELLTTSEINVLSTRWRILNLLNQGKTQREITKELGVSLCNITRGAKVLKNKNTLISKHLNGDKTNDNTSTQTLNPNKRRIFWKLRRPIH